jgi:hypothetical protein
MLAYCRYFPVASPARILDANLLSQLKGIGLEDSDIMFHGISPKRLSQASLAIHKKEGTFSE